MNRRNYLCLWGVALGLFYGAANAYADSPFCTPGLGGQVFSSGQKMEIEMLYPESGPVYIDNLFLASPVRTDVLARNEDPGKVVEIGKMSPGEEIVFSMFVQNTGNTFTIGPGTRNPDGIPHATVKCVENGPATIGFEDIPKGGDLHFADSDYGYNDLIFVLRPVRPVVIGDVDDNGRIDIRDVLLILRSAVGLIQLSSRQKLAGDVDGEGYVNHYDAELLLRKLAGLSG